MEFSEDTDGRALVERQGTVFDMVSRYPVTIVARPCTLSVSPDPRIDVGCCPYRWSDYTLHGHLIFLLLQSSCNVTIAIVLAERCTGDWCSLYKARPSL